MLLLLPLPWAVADGLAAETGAEGAAPLLSVFRLLRFLPAIIISDDEGSRPFRREVWWAVGNRCRRLLGLLHLSLQQDEMLLLLLEATSCVLLPGPEITAPAVPASLLGARKPSAPRVRWVATLARPRRTVEGFMGLVLQVATQERREQHWLPYNSMAMGLTDITTLNSHLSYMHGAQLLA